MKSVKILATAAIGALALFTTSAYADIVCNGEGDCWHVREHRDYKPELKLEVHPDTWKWAEHDRHRWHEHAGHGYWRGGVWIDL